MIVKTLGLMTLNNNTNMVPNGIANNTPPERTSIPSMPRVEGLTNAWVLASVGVLVGLVLGLIGCIAICDVMLFGDNTGVSEAKEGTEAKDGTEGKKARRQRRARPSYPGHNARNCSSRSRPCIALETPPIKSNALLWNILLISGNLAASMPPFHTAQPNMSKGPDISLSPCQVRQDHGMVFRLLDLLVNEQDPHLTSCPNNRVHLKLKWTPSLGQDRSGIKRESRRSCL